MSASSVDLETAKKGSILYMSLFPTCHLFDKWTALLSPLRSQQISFILYEVQIFTNLITDNNVMCLAKDMSSDLKIQTYDQI